MANSSKFQTLINGEQPVLVDFHATWCGPCKAMMPIVKQVAELTSGKARVIKVDIDKNKDFADRLQIRGVPTFMLYKSGEVVWRQSGMQSAQDLLKVIGEHV